MANPGSSTLLGHPTTTTGINGTASTDGRVTLATEAENSGSLEGESKSTDAMETDGSISLGLL